MSFWDELKRRNVVKVAAAYLVASWLVIQVVGVLTEPLNLPERLDTVVVVLLAIGFPVALLVAWAYELTPEGIRRASEVEPAASIAQVTGQRLNLIVTILLAALVGILIVERYATNSETTLTATPDARSLPAGPPFRLAAMPMRSLSTRDEDVIFAAGLTSVFIDQLALIDEFEVVDEASILVYENRREPPETIAEELQVDLLLDTTIRADDESLVVAARLLAGDSWRSLGQFTRPRGSVLALQDDIAIALTEALSLELGVSASAVGQAPTISAAAYDAYVRGRAHLSRFRNDEAVAAFIQAVAEDDQFALAWMALANAYGQSDVIESDPERVAELRQLRADAIERARDLDPSLIDPDVVRAGDLWVQMDWIGSGRAWEAAIRRDQDNRFEGFAGGHLAHVGRAAEAADIYVQGLAGNELSALYAGQAGWALDIAGRNQEALTQLDRSTELNGGVPLFFGQHFQALLVSSDARRIQDFRDALPPSSSNSNLGLTGSDPLVRLVDAWQSPEAAIEILQEVLNEPIEANPSARFPQFAVLAAYHGEVQLALEIAQEAYVRRRSIYTIYLWHPLMSEVRKTDEFKRLVTELGLVDYWREFVWADSCRPLSDDDFECF